MSSDPDALSAGAYVIRNKKTSTVLHISSPDANKDGSDLLAYRQDESQYKDQQIWWVEPLANHNLAGGAAKSGKEVIYSITSPSSGRSLDTHPRTGNVCAWLHHGDPWQRWKLRKVVGDDGEVSYNIISVLNDKAVDIVGQNPKPGTRVHMWKHYPGYDQQCWEFLTPLVSFPPGWFHMQNVGTGDLLSHDYVYNAPALLPPPRSPRQSQFREHWGFQWALAHSKCFDSSGSGERNSWCIINRLTRVRLSPHLGNINDKDFEDRYKNLAWKLELDAFCNWKITNRKTSCLLEKTNVAHDGSPGTAAICNSQKFIQRGGSQSWVLRPPLLYMSDELLPEYEATEG